MKQICTILITISLNSCHLLSYRQEPNEKFNQIINVLPDNNRELKYNGLYTLISIDSSSLVSDTIHRKDDSFIDPIMFYGNGIVDYIGDIYFSNNEKRKSYIDKKNKFTNLPCGIFSVNNKKIEASIYMVFEGNGDGFNIWYLCNFTGVIDGNRILNWKMIPPVPKFTKLEKRQDYNQKKITYLMQSKDFEFKPFIYKTMLDSNNIWINKYKKMP